MTASRSLFSTLLILSIAHFNLAVAQMPPVNEEGVTPGYLLVTGWYKDSAVQGKYLKKVAPLIRKHGFVIAKMGVPEINLRVLEGDWVPRPFSLMQFDSEKSVKQFWTSSEYQNEVKPIRVGKSAVDVIKAGSAFGTTTAVTEQSALLVFLGDITNRKKLLTEYVPKAPAVVAKFGGQYLVSSAQWGMELLEGDYPSGSIVVLQFPNAEALSNFWNDEEYKKLSEIRKSAGSWSVIEIMPVSFKTKS